MEQMYCFDNYMLYGYSCSETNTRSYEEEFKFRRYICLQSYSSIQAIRDVEYSNNKYKKISTFLIRKFPPLVPGTNNHFTEKEWNHEVNYFKDKIKSAKNNKIK